MAKWTIEFEDTYMENGGPAVSFIIKSEGDAVVDSGWTPATCCALMLDYLWATEAYQQKVHRDMDEVAAYQLAMVAKNKALQESSTLSDKS